MFIPPPIPHKMFIDFYLINPWDEPETEGTRLALRYLRRLRPTMNEWDDKGMLIVETYWSRNRWLSPGIEMVLRLLVDTHLPGFDWPLIAEQYGPWKKIEHTHDEEFEVLFG